ncbi:REP-associated tyrosine transposase [Pseudomonas sp. NA-150]|uniref:REP-associated tyrosine transposase n=1 Tax=Pseudomonas sp. NA-150 TaxID=3367525 RepID=UPI0037C8F1C6
MPNLFKGHRLRTGRFSDPGNFYVLTAVTAQRNPVFSDWQLGRLVVQQFRSAEEQGMAQSLAWVVMPDHFHWTIELRSQSLSQLMCRVKSRSSRAIKQRTSYEGIIWQRGYYDRALRHEEDLKAAARYIVANPLRAGLVARIGDYPLWDTLWL